MRVVANGNPGVAEWRWASGSLILLFLLSLPLVTPRIYGGDEVQYFAPLRSLWKDGDLDYRNEYAHLFQPVPGHSGRGEREMFLEHSTPTGRVPNFAPVGSALFWAPFFALGNSVAGIGRWPTDGYSYPYMVAICFGSAVYGFLGLGLLYDMARRELSERVALPGALLAWWATALPFYMYVTPPMAHATSVFSTSLFIWLWHRRRSRGSGAHFAMLGLAGGLMTMVREQNALFMVLPGIDFATSVLRARKEGNWQSAVRAILHSILLGAVFLVTILPQFVVWKTLFGQFGPAGQRISFFTPLPVHLGEVLVSSNHGLLSWHPVWIVGIVGMVLFAREKPQIGWPLLTAFALQLLFLGSVSNWAGGMAFGQRRVLDCLFVVVLGGAMALRRVPRQLTAALSLLLVWWNISLLVQFGSGMIPREGPVVWSEIVHNQVAVIPKEIWSLIGRYFRERESFHERGAAAQRDS